MNKANLILIFIIIPIVIVKLYLMTATRDRIGISIELQLLNISVFVAIVISLVLMHVKPNIAKAMAALMVLLGCIELFWKYMINYNNLAYSLINIVGYFVFGFVLWFMAEAEYKKRILSKINLP